MAIPLLEQYSIERYVVGPIQTNCYIISTDTACVVIDPGAEPEFLLRQLGDRKPDLIVLTHRHPDHIEALADLVDATKAPVYAHELDVIGIEHPELDRGPGSAFGHPRATHVDFKVSDGAKITAGDIELTVMHTPGHTIGGICLLLNDSDGNPAMLFSGDTLFAGSIGRTDLETGDFDQIMESIRTKIMPLPDDVAVMPGHGPASLIGHEKATNPYMQG